MPEAANVRLVAATAELLALEGKDLRALCSELGVVAPPSWPPEYCGEQFRSWLLKKLEAPTAEENWLSNYVVADGQLAGTAGYKGKPNLGIVEVGYSVVPELQRRGIATAAVRQLVDRAFTDSAVESVVAETLETLPASQKVLVACGFALASRSRQAGDISILRYSIAKPAI